ncbi:MAG: hypothetical protein R2715_03935, partial [Ilumatobacteraceae bacterium]
KVPYVVALNKFDGQLAHSPAAVREALSLDPSTPVFGLDCRSRPETKQALIELVKHAIAKKRTDT